MRILAVIRQVLDAEENVKVKDGSVHLAGSKLVMDTMDEYGVEEALRLRESDSTIEVVVLAIGPPRCEEALRNALAMGADRAILVEAEEPLDAIATSSVVAQVAKGEARPNSFFCGGQQADWGLPRARRRHGGASELAAGRPGPGRSHSRATSLPARTMSMPAARVSPLRLPVVVTTQQGLNEPRYPTLPNIMKAKRKEMRRDALATYSATAMLKVLGADVQVKERRRTILDGKDAAAAANQLVDLLRNEARVI